MIENRRQPRVHFNEALPTVEITWPNLETSRVLNLSRTGAQVARPGLYEFDAQSPLTVDLRSGGFDLFLAPVRCVWRNLDRVGLEFKNLPARAYPVLEDVVSLNLLGQKLRPVDRVYFKRSQNFSEWYQAAGRAHVWIWRGATGAIDRVEVELENARHVFERGARYPERARRALSLLSQMDKAGRDMEDFRRTLDHGV